PASWIPDMVAEVEVEELIPLIVFLWITKLCAFPRSMPRKLSLSATVVEPSVLSEISQLASKVVAFPNRKNAFCTWKETLFRILLLLWGASAGLPRVALPERMPAMVLEPRVPVPSRRRFLKVFP